MKNEWLHCLYLLLNSIEELLLDYYKLTQWQSYDEYAEAVPHMRF